MRKIKIGFRKSAKTVGILLFAAGTLLAIGVIYANQTFSEIKNNVVRLHVIANSDSTEDQALKLQVRDKVVEYVETMDFQSDNAEDYAREIEGSLDEISKAVNEYLEESGEKYTATVTVGESTFPAKNYGDIVLPSGKYKAIKVTLGEGQGKNWWCVMFPPLCCTNSGNIAVSEDGKDALQQNLSNEAYKTVVGEADDNVTLVADDGLVSENVKVNVRFKIVEVFRSSGQKIANTFDKCWKFLSGD